jgi:SAM-dependent methyltransferase
MKKPSLLTCPVCRAADRETIYKLSCGNLDKSRLYPTVRINHCLRCGHIFNELTAEALAGLAGGLTTERYDQLYRALSPHINIQQDILDVGCALGGFLDYLSEKGFKRLSGVDMTETYVEQARLKNTYRIEIGNAESLPFDDHVFDVIVMEQVLEHLFNPLQAFQEARRVLRKGGIFCIGVPDAARYADFIFFDFYWLLLREHIQHFDIVHLDLLGNQTGFDLLEGHETVHAIMTERMIMPNLYAVFRLTGSNPKSNESDNNNFKLIRLLNGYIRQEEARQSIKRQIISELIQSQRPVYAWGIGREFLYLYESAGLKHCNLAGLIDANPFKQMSCTVGGIKIARREDLLPGAAVDSVLLITAIAHMDAIKLAAKELGFKGKVLDLIIDSDY